MQALYTLVDSRWGLATCTLQHLDGWEPAVRSGERVLIEEHHLAATAVARAEEIQTAPIAVG